METQLYIRIRGRVLGPYDQEKLQFLARRGQLSRMHEVSPDGATWSQASNYPAIFSVEVAGMVADERERADAQAARQAAGGASEYAVVPPRTLPPAPSGSWHYNSNGRQCGPVDAATLRQMLLAGQIPSDELIWTEGMAAWTPASQVPGFGLHESRAGAGRDAGKDGAQGLLPLELCKAATASRGWVMFLAVTTFVYAGLSFLGGLLLLIQGANWHLAPVIASGLFGLVYAAVAGVGGTLLLNYAGHVRTLVHARHPAILEKALESLRAIWIFVSILLIVFLTLISIALIWAIAIGGSFPANLMGRMST